MKISKFATIIAVLITIIHVNSTFADDLDAFKQLAKSNALILMDTSGSMSWPVYDPDVDYGAFMKWMIDNGYAYDDEDCGETTWWGSSYNKLDRHGIYLVKSPIGHRSISYTDSSGDSQVKSATGDVMHKTSDSSNYRDNWLTQAIIPCMNAANNPWKEDDDASIDTTESGGKKFVVFPQGSLSDIVNTGTSVTVDAGITGRLKNSQDVEIHKPVLDPMTNQIFDYGFLGFIQSSGYYFSGLFEKSAWGHNFTDSHSDWVTDTVYIFASGNWLNFLKLVEDFKLHSNYSSCQENWTYSFQRYLAWKYICYKPGDSDPEWNSKTINIRSHDTDYHPDGDYPDSPRGYFERGSITATQFTEQIKVKFQYVDTDFQYGYGNYDDFVLILDGETNQPLLAIAGNDYGPGTGAYVSTDGGSSWNWSSSFFDAEGYTPPLNAKQLKIYFRNGYASGVSGRDRGFQITGYKYVNALAGGAGGFTCCNGVNGVGYKIKSRMDIAKSAMINAVELTKDTINWGLSRFNSGSGATLLASLGSSPTAVIDELEDLEAGGSTPLGEALQDSYEFNETYLSNNPDAAECSANFVLAVTDGFPSDDGGWSRIAGVTFGKCTSGTGNYTCGTSPYGDSDVWPDSSGSLNNYMDDVAHWMYHKANYRHTVHSIAFGLDNPMLNDVADSSDGVYITAYNEDQLLNAFYSLGLSMTNAISFAAPAISVDEENRAQAGDELYMAFFRPDRTDYWQGNLKKFKIDWNATSESVVDVFGNKVTDADGSFKTSSRSFWSTENDGGQINKGGAGGVLLEKVETNFTTPNYYDRMLYTFKGGALTPFTKNNMEPSDFGVSTDEEEAEIINFMYGFAYDADASTNPTAVRNWILGDIIHSEPLVLDYVDDTYTRGLTDRYIAIGSNHGILHVFDTEDGSELFGFVPPSLLTSLDNFDDPTEHVYGVDGQLSKFQTGRNPELMVFGLRRGGNAYYAIDVSNSTVTDWDLAWSVTNTGDFAELGQTWSKMYFSTMPQVDNTTLDIGVFTGGYDPAEDAAETGVLPSGDSQGRGIFVVNANDGSLVFKCTYGTSNSTASATAYTRSDMKWCFPADPRVIRLPAGHKDGDLVIYAVDVAGQLWKFLYDKDSTPKWRVHRIFNSNGPTNTEGGANVASGLSDKLDSDDTLDSSDIGRKCFSQPDVSYAGDCTTDQPVVYFGTGDRSHPLDTTVKNRFYGIFDMSTNSTTSPYYNVVLDETDLLNISYIPDSQNSTIRLKLGDDYTTKAQGWYINFTQQNDSYDHTGEKLTSSPRLFNKILFFTTYKPTFEDVCAPNGDSLLYAIDYCYGSPIYNWTDSSGNPTRYQLHQNSPLASSWRIMAKGGIAAGKISVGAKLINIPIDIQSGLNMIWWDYD